MAEFSRKQLKQDRFAEVVGQEVALFRRHKTAITIGAVAVIAAILGGYSYSAYRERVSEEASRAFMSAVRLYGGVVTTEPRPGFVTYTTAGERQRRVTEAFEEILRDYPNREEAAGAHYYLGLLDIEQEKNEEAKADLEKAVAEGGEYASMARLALADLLARMDQLEESKQHYERLIDNPSGLVPKERAQLAYARMLADKDPEAAKPLLEELMAQPGAVSVAAGTTLRRLQGSS